MRRNKGLSFYRRRKKVNAAILAEVLKYIVGIAISVFLAVVLVWLFGPLAGKALSEKIRLSLKGKNLKHKKAFPEKYIGRLADRLENDRISLCLLGHFHQTAAMRGIRVLPAWCPDGEIGIFDPETYQKARAWAWDYRRYHDLWITKEKVKICRANFKQAKPQESQGDT